MSNQRRAAAAVCATLGLAAAALFVFDPAGAAFYPRCFFRSLTGWHCPGCGTTRAAHALLHADFAAAFRLNPLLFSAFPFVALLAAKPSIRKCKAIPWIFLAVVAVYWFLRNIPHHPFNLLAPCGPNSGPHGFTHPLSQI